MADRGAADPGAVDAQKADGENELADDEPERAQDYRRSVEDAELPDEVREAALREVGKLERTRDQNPESGDDIQAWLDTILALPWSTKTTDWIDIQGPPEVESTQRRLTEPTAADVEKANTAEAGPAAADGEEANTAGVEPALAVVEEADADQHAQFAEQAVLQPEPVQAPARKRRSGSLALAAIVLVALLISALIFTANRDGSVTAQSVSTVTATATATVSKPTSKPSDKSTDIGGGKATIQLEDLADSGRPFQPVRIHGTYRGGADTLLRVQRWEDAKWIAFPIPTTTDQSGQFTTYVELGQPGRYRLRVLEPNSGATSKPFVLVIED